MHVVDANGRVRGGAKAFARLWRELPGYRGLGHLIGLPGFTLIAEAVYRLRLATNPGLRTIDTGARGARHA